MYLLLSKIGSNIKGEFFKDPAALAGTINRMINENSLSFNPVTAKQIKNIKDSASFIDINQVFLVARIEQANSFELKL